MLQASVLTLPRPVPPEKPLASDCCDGGCDPCVHDLYAEAMRAYEAAMAAWHAARQGDAHGQGVRGQPGDDAGRGRDRPGHR